MNRNLRQLLVGREKQRFNPSLPLFCALFFAACAPAFAALGTKGTSGAEFLELAVNARAVAMGEAFTAVGEDSDSIYFNPAGVMSIKQNLVAITYEVTRKSALSTDQIFSMEPLRNMNLISLAVVGNKGAFSWRPLTNTDDRVVTPAGWEETQVKVQAFTFTGPCTAL